MFKAPRDRGQALREEREAARARRFTPRHLIETGGQAVALCRQCNHFDFLDLKSMPPTLDLRFSDGRFRCRCRSTFVVIGIARAVGDVWTGYGAEK
jgi:hypothetical protein